MTPTSTPCVEIGTDNATGQPVSLAVGNNVLIVGDEYSGADELMMWLETQLAKTTTTWVIDSSAWPGLAGEPQATRRATSEQEALTLINDLIEWIKATRLTRESVDDGPDPQWDPLVLLANFAFWDDRVLAAVFQQLRKVAVIGRARKVYVVARAAHPTAQMVLPMLKLCGTQIAMRPTANPALVEVMTMGVASTQHARAARDQAFGLNVPGQGMILARDVLPRAFTVLPGMNPRWREHAERTGPAAPPQPPRQEPAESARRHLHRLLDQVGSRLGLTYPQLLLAIAGYKVGWLRQLGTDIKGPTTRTATDVRHLAIPDGESNAVIAVADAVKQVEQLPEPPTGAEILMLLGLYEQRINGYLISVEREV